MAYDEQLAERIRGILAGDRAVTEKKMFGGLAFLREGHMFAGVSGDRLMARVGKEHSADSLARPHVREMDFTGRPLQGYVYVEPPGLATDADLRFWIARCTAFVATLGPKTPKRRSRSRSA